MSALNATQIRDLVTTSLNELGRMKFTDLMSNYQRTIALKRIFKKKKMTFKSGPEVEFNVITDTDDSARFVGLGYQAVVNITDAMTTGKVPWRHCTHNWSFERREPLFNSGASKIVDMVKTRRLRSLGGLIELFERHLWRVPAASNTTEPYGIPYYVVKSNTAATFANNDGFNGTVPSGYTTVADLNPTTFPRWRNYATQYTAVTKDDFVKKARRMSVKIDFMPLVDGVPEYNTGDDMAYYTNYTVLGTLEEILEAQNENLGSDVASQDGKVTFRRAPVEYVPELENDTTNPFYALNWGEIGAMGLSGDWMKETVFDSTPNQPTVHVTHIDCTFNLLCRNRRRQGVLATDTGLPA